MAHNSCTRISVQKNRYRSYSSSFLGDDPACNMCECFPKYDSFGLT